MCSFFVVCLVRLFELAKFGIFRRFASSIIFRSVKCFVFSWLLKQLLLSLFMYQVALGV